MKTSGRQLTLQGPNSSKSRRCRSHRRHRVAMHSAVPGRGLRAVERVSGSGRTRQRSLTRNGRTCRTRTRLSNRRKDDEVQCFLAGNTNTSALFSMPFASVTKFMYRLSLTSRTLPVIFVNYPCYFFGYFCTEVVVPRSPAFRQSQV